MRLKSVKNVFFAMTVAWSEINYGVITDKRMKKGENTYIIYNSDEDKYYEREAGWIRQP